MENTQITVACHSQATYQAADPTDTRPTRARRWRGAALALGLAAALSLTACASNERPTSPTDSPGGDSLSGTINAGGSSAQTAAQEAWRAGFQSAHSSVTINYDPIGSGPGREGFAAGAYGLAGSDDAFKLADIASTEFTLCASGSGIVEVPAYISPIVVAYNLPGLSDLNLDAAVIAHIFTGQIKTWDDPAIAALNPGQTLPATAITPVHRSDKSGTTGNFTDYLSQAAPNDWTAGRTETWPQDLGGEAAEKTQGVRQAVSSAAGAVGYIDASQATGLGVAALVVDGTPVAPSAAGATRTVAASQLESGRGSADLVFAINRTPSEPGAYPLIMVSYLVACQQYTDASQAALVKAYLAWAVSASGQEAAAANAGSAALGSDPTLAARVGEAVDSIR
ncbi:MAG: phosphate ABC transporter substrate-binding protein PstS [Propionibacteriaceae bacterium]|jgi:phosphate transport system substrate-binding protein|nr:phosphate ABC transporter substrate-binding protein PstS [Propionibacteriaceae bacterium]